MFKTTPFKATRSYFSFKEIPDPTRHRDYNIWHQLDHRPENFALDGVTYGERWVCSPDCLRARLVFEPPFAKIHYLNMYWFSEPFERSWKEFRDFSDWSLKMPGRRPDIPISRSYFNGVFVPVKGYAAPRVLVSPEAIPFRPTRGIIVRISDTLEPDSADARDMLAWYDQVHIPDMLECKGVAGAWTFTSDPAHVTGHSMNPNPAGRRIQIYYLDEDPLESLADVLAQMPAWKAAGRLRDNGKSEKDLLFGPLRTIIPWQWDWFEKESS